MAKQLTFAAVSALSLLLNANGCGRGPQCAPGEVGNDVLQACVIPKDCPAGTILDERNECQAICAEGTTLTDANQCEAAMVDGGETGTLSSPATSGVAGAQSRRTRAASSDAGDRDAGADASSAGGTGGSSSAAGGSDGGREGVAGHAGGGEAGGAPTASARCGDGKVDPAEMCDGNCKNSCPPAVGCVGSELKGSPMTCDVECVPTTISTVKDGDGCCPMDATSATDMDCPRSCGDGKLTSDEKCEPGSSDHPCPTAKDCDDGDPCTMDMVAGTAQQCTAQCAHMPITRAAMSCDDGDPCTDDMMVESETACTYECEHTVARKPTGSCADADPCTDDTPVPSKTRCAVECPHARREPEPANCADDDPCTDDTPSLSATSCAYECPHRRQQPTAISCDDGNQCTADTQVLSKSRCAYECEHKNSTSNKTGTPETSCNNRDDDCDGKTDEGVLNECNGCGMVHYEPQAVPPGKPCAYYWDNDNSGDCSTTGVGKCVGTDTVICDAPRPACAP